VRARIAYLLWNALRRLFLLFDITLFAVPRDSGVVIISDEKHLDIHLPVNHRTPAGQGAIKLTLAINEAMNDPEIAAEAMKRAQELLDNLSV